MFAVRQGSDGLPAPLAVFRYSQRRLHHAVNHQGDDGAWLGAAGEQWAAIVGGGTVGQRRAIFHAARNVIQHCDDARCRGGNGINRQADRYRRRAGVARRITMAERKAVFTVF